MATPNQIAIAATCFINGIPRGDQLGAAIYLWNVMSGLNLTPEALRAASKCFTATGGFPAGDQMGALLYLINQGGGSTGGIQSFSGSGPPTTQTPTGNSGFYWDYTNNILYMWQPISGTWTQ